ncbi:MAG: hypothetical protein ACRECQ_02695 [Burkholderiaceae bacterium]
MSRQSCIAGAGLLIALTAAAQTQGTATPRCASAEHRQFDFWLGEWDVTQNGKAAGRNTIQSILNGCAISEDWSGTGGFRGNSLNFYNADTKRWHQTWIDSQGQSLALDGQLEGGSMVLQSAGTPRHRITWTPMPGKTLRQVWQVQETPGAEWKTLFDGRYSMRSQ